MSFINNVRKIFVASNVTGLSAAVQKLLPSLEVVDLNKNHTGSVRCLEVCAIEI